MTAHLTGYASLTGVPYEVAGYTESIKRGAFKATLASKPDVQLLLNHSGLAMARTTAGTLRLSEDSHGLKVDADLDTERSDVADLLRAMTAHAVDQMSFAFQATTQEWSKDYSHRSINALSIHRGDVSVVNMGASPTTFVSARKAPDLAQRRQLAESIGKLVIGHVEFRALTIERGGVVFAELDCRALRSGGVGTSNWTSRPDIPYAQRSRRQRQTILAGGDLADRFLRAYTPVAVVLDPTRKQVCPICRGDGKVTAASRACSNCSGKGWTAITPHAGTATDGSSL